MNHSMMKMTTTNWVAAAVAAMAWLATAQPVLASADLEPVELLDRTAGQILSQLNERRDEFSADPDLLKAIIREDLLPLIDLDYSSRLILGKAGRGVTPAQLDAFAGAMSNVLINRYADGLLQFRSEDQMEILPLKGKNTEKLTRVRTRIKLDNGNFAPIDYAFRKTDAGWKAFDVTVEGISYVITFRNQIAPRVSEVGIDKVTADLVAGTFELDE